MSKWVWGPVEPDENMLDYDGWYRMQPSGMRSRKARQTLTHRRNLYKAMLAAAPPPDGCAWREDEDGNWFGDCGAAWQFTDGGPVENHVTYCPQCGSHVTAVPFEYPPGEDE